MKMVPHSRLVFLGCLAVAALLVQGCKTCKPGSAPKITRYPVTVNLSPALKDSSMEVDIVGVNPAGLTRMSNYSMSEYWKDGDAMRREVDKVTFNFVDGKSLSQTLDLKAPIWTNWTAKGVTHLVVLSRLPLWQTIPDKPGNQDARRQILSLNKCKWANKTTQLTLQVQRSGIEVQTPIRPGWETE